jgi:hypothetical protein
MKILIVGKITERSKQQFMDVETKLRLEGHEVENPAKSIPKVYLSDEDYIIRYFLRELSNNTNIYLLPDWFTMPGASIIQSIIKLLFKF